MKTIVDQNREQRTVPTLSTHKKPGTNLVNTLVDNRPATVYQRQLLDTMHTHHMSNPLQTYRKNNPSKSVPPDLSTLPGRTAPVYQLARNKKGDKEKLANVYHLVVQHIGNLDGNNLEAFKAAIYNMLGGEHNPGYQVYDVTDLPLIRDERVASDLEAKAGNNIVRSHHLLTDQEKRQRIAYNEIGFNEGAYFQAHNPRHYEANPTTGPFFNERMIINTLTQRDAGELVRYIVNGWDDLNVTDWRRWITIAKFFGISEHGKANHAKPIKYDKVVLYYDSRYRNIIAKGVKKRLPKKKRVAALSAFYDVIAKGIGVGEQVGKGSFTDARVDTLVGWIGLEAWDQVRDGTMTERQFIKAATQVILEEMVKNKRGRQEPEL
ncbi:MAG: hypothetical protein AAGA66_18260 [Bacteroidota bacterium]